MNDPLKMLKHDYEVSLDILHDLRVSEPGRKRLLLVDQLKSSFRNHQTLESEWVYPLVADTTGRNDTTDRGVEHEMLGECLDRLTLLVDEPGFCVAAAMLAGGLKHHVKREEKVVLPALKKSLGSGEWKALGDRLLVAKAEVEAKKRVDAAANLQQQQAAAMSTSTPLASRKLVASK
jgi:iron-sulfur cluster repair protein YtfE (RIC family)